jgi:hypothetical protein
MTFKLRLVPLIEPVEVAKKLSFPVFFGVVPAYHTKSRDRDGIGINLIPVIVENTAVDWFYHLFQSLLMVIKIHNNPINFNTFVSFVYILSAYLAGRQ